MENNKEYQKALAIVTRRYDSYKDIKKLGVWKDYNVYEPVVENEAVLIGPNEYFLVNEDENRWTNLKEEKEIFSYFSKKA